MSALRATENLPAIEVVRSAVAALRDRWWLVVATVIVAAGGWLAWDQIAPREHTASVLVEFTRPLDNPTFAALGVAALPSPTGADLVSEPVLKTLQTRKRPSIDYLRDHLRVDQHGVEGSAELRARASSTARAVALANRWATNFVLYRNGQIAQQLVSARKAVRQDLARARKAHSGSSATAARDRLARLSVASRTVVGDTAVVSAATPVSDDNRGLSSFALTAISGLLLGCALALLAAWWDRRFRTPAAIAAAMRAPLVGVLPRDSTAFRRAAASLGANLDLLTGGEAPSRILVTSVDATTSAEQVQEVLAAAYARAGTSVVLASWVLEGGGDDAPSPLQEHFVMRGTWRQIRPRIEQLGRQGVVIVSAGLASRAEEALLAARDFDAILLCGTVGLTRTDDVEALAERLDLVPDVRPGVVVFEPSRRRRGRGRPLPSARRQIDEPREDSENESRHRTDADAGEYERQEREKAESQR
jgi:hypothetical protein